MGERSKNRNWARWGYLLIAACLGWLLHSRVQNYQRFLTLAASSPEEWNKIAMEYRFSVVFLGFLVLEYVLRFFLFDRDPRELKMKLLDAISSVVILLLVLAYMWAAKEFVKWIIPAALLVWLAVIRWRDVLKIRREREME
jgi:hypothetical protein